MDTRIDKAMNASYLREGKWKCKKSPTGAHHWLSLGESKRHYQCVYCREGKMFPSTFAEATGKDDYTPVSPLDD